MDYSKLTDKELLETMHSIEKEYLFFEEHALNLKRDEITLQINDAQLKRIIFSYLRKTTELTVNEKYLLRALKSHLQFREGEHLFQDEIDQAIKRKNELEKCLTILKEEKENRETQNNKKEFQKSEVKATQEEQEDHEEIQLNTWWSSILLKNVEHLENLDHLDN